MRPCHLLCFVSCNPQHAGQNPSAHESDTASYAQAGFTSPVRVAIPGHLNIRLWPLPQGTAERFVNASVSISLHIILPHITQLSFSIWNLISLGVIGSKPSFPQPYLRYLYIETWIHSFDLCLLFRFFTNHIETKEKNTATKDTSTAQ